MEVRADNAMLVRSVLSGATSSASVVSSRYSDRTRLELEKLEEERALFTSYIDRKYATKAAEKERERSERSQSFRVSSRATSRVEEVQSRGGSCKNVRKPEIVTPVKSLLRPSDKRGCKRQETPGQRQYNRTVEDTELWLSEMEEQVLSEDYGKDLPSVQDLQRKQALLESDVKAHQDRIDYIKVTANKFVESGHVDADNIRLKEGALLKRYAALAESMAYRKQRLLESLQVQQLFHDLEDEAAWIRTKDPMAASTNFGRDLIGVQNLITKHQELLAKINNHESKFAGVISNGEQMLNDRTTSNEEIKLRINALKGEWNSLKEKSNQRKQDLKVSLQAHLYFADAKGAESWMREKEPIVLNQDYGNDVDSSKALLKKHEALVSNLEAFGSTIQALQEQVRDCRQQALIVDITGKRCVMPLYYDHTGKSSCETSMRKSDAVTLLNSNKDRRKVEEHDCQGFVPAVCTKRIDSWLSASKQIPIDGLSIADRQAQINSQYDNLLSLARERQNGLNETVKAYVVMREAADLAVWIKDKESQALIKDVGEDLEEIESLQKKFDDFKDDLKANEVRLTRMNEIAIQLTSLGQTKAALKVKTQMQTLNEKWAELQTRTQDRISQLGSAHELQRFYRDVDETKEWVAGKRYALNNDELGKDLRGVQTLQRKHEVLERDLATLQDKICQLDETANRLMQSHPDTAKQTYAKQKEINEEWQQVVSKAQQRKEKLLESYDLQRFLSDYRDLSAWVGFMIGPANSGELANDVAGVEVLIERHQEHLPHDARASTFSAFEQFGNELLLANHYAAPEIQEKIENLAKVREELKCAWTARQLQLDQNLPLQLHLRNCEQAENWMSTRRAFVSTEEVYLTGDNLDAKSKEHEDLRSAIDKAINGHEEKVSARHVLADQLIAQEHYAGKLIYDMLDRWRHLKEDLIEKRWWPGEDQTLQQFLRDVDATENWITERLQLATDEGYKDPANIESKHQQYQEFKAELANADGIQSVLAISKSLWKLTRAWIGKYGVSL
uniref:Uncharacterized protein n=1 Tax=Anopheles albimanus TaxID=7167 RepID=A0A182FBJ8_ANOAL